MNNFKKLKIWNQSIDLSHSVFVFTKSLPKPDSYDVVNQSRRAAVSIASNIAEGCGRGSNKDFCRFLNIALGSSYELETQLIILKRLFAKETANLEAETVSIQKQIQSLIKKLNSTGN
ncbi:MAG: four helix bundle protein [Bacteroidia bacterium]|nr:four helix bundle protein [Bacteroidia bacterium]